MSSDQKLQGWQRSYLDRWYSRADGWVDGTTKFHAICRDALEGRGPHPSLLEVGSGPPNPSSEFFSTLGRLTGVDTDPVIMRNPAVSEAHVVTGETLPFEDCTFDACFSNWVLEHIPNPEAHLAEVNRVLKPGGRYVARTPNRYHYVSLVAAATPQWFHALVANRLRALPEDAHEPWQTFYRLNTRKAVRRTAVRSGFVVDAIRVLESEPSYGMASKPLFLAFMLYERLVNATSRLEWLRHSMIVVLQKPPDGSEA